MSPMFEKGVIKETRSRLNNNMLHKTPTVILLLVAKWSRWTPSSEALDDCLNRERVINVLSGPERRRSWDESLESNCSCGIR